MGSRREVDWSSQMNWVCACYHDDDDDGRTAGRCWPEEESHDYRQRGRWWCDIDAAVCGDGQGFRAADDRGMECIIIIKSKGRSCNLKVNRISLLYTRASSSSMHRAVVSCCCCWFAGRVELHTMFFHTQSNPFPSLWGENESHRTNGGREVSNSGSTALSLGHSIIINTRASLDSVYFDCLDRQVKVVG